MTTSDVPEGVPDWGAVFEQVGDAYLDALERNAAAQQAFLDQWVEATAEADGELAREGIESYARAYEVWMAASEDALDRLEDAAGGEEVTPEDFRDIWLKASNDALTEVMGSPAFAAATGQNTETLLNLQDRIDEASRETLHELGLAAEADVREVGERLVELERRQHAVEEKLDRVLDHLEE